MRSSRNSILKKLALICSCGLILMGLWAFFRPRFLALQISSEDGLKGWQTIAGRWSEHSGVISNAHYGRGDMLIAPSSYGTNYHMAADVRFDFLFTETHYGDAGLVIRATDPEPGVDSYRGYYAGLRPDSQTLVLGRASYDWHTLAESQLTFHVVAGQWYHIELSSRGCNLTATASLISYNAQETQIKYTDNQCLTDGMTGLRSFYTQASWRNVKIDTF